MAARQTTFSRLRRFAIILGMAILPAACGQSMDTQLPDLKSKSAPPDGRRVMTQAEQQKAIDDLIAKRDKGEAAR